MNFTQHAKWPKLVLCTLIASLISLMIWLNFFSPFVLVTVSGKSMEPTFKNGTWYLANKPNQTLKNGDVIVFKIKNITYIKRVVAVSGDKLPLCYDIEEDGKFSASIVNADYIWLNMPHEWIPIPFGYVWVEGDAVENHISVGSGEIGLIDIKNVIAVMNETEAPKNFWYPQVVNQDKTLIPHFTH